MLKALSFLWLGALLSAGAAFCTQVILARQLGPADFGAFSAAISAVTLIAPLAGFGIASFWLKAFGKEGYEGLRWIRPSLAFTSLSILAVIALTIAWSMTGPHDTLSKQLFLVLSLYITGHTAIELGTAVFQLEGRFTQLALFQLLPHAMRLFAVAILSVYFGDRTSAESLAISYAAIALTLFAIGLHPIGRLLSGNITLKGHEASTPYQRNTTPRPPTVADILKESWPFGLAGIFHLIYFQSDIILLKYLAGDDQAGQYNVAFVLMTAAYIFPAVVYQKYLLPKIHRLANRDLPALRRLYQRGNTLMALTGAVATLCIIALAPLAIPLLFGTAYTQATGPLLILAFAAPIRFVATSVGAMLVTQDNMRRKVTYMGAVAIINLILNLTLIPIYGMTGAAISTVFCEALLLLLYWRSVRRFVFNPC